jgi:hypothetical protein
MPGAIQRGYNRGGERTDNNASDRRIAVRCFFQSSVARRYNIFC